MGLSSALSLATSRLRSLTAAPMRKNAPSWVAKPMPIEIFRYRALSDPARRGFLLDEKTTVSSSGRLIFAREQIEKNNATRTSAASASPNGTEGMKSPSVRIIGRFIDLSRLENRGKKVPKILK